MAGPTLGVFNPVPIISSSMFGLDTWTEMMKLSYGAAGDGHDPYFIVFILWGIVLPVIVGFGLIGNILTMLVLWRKEMQSATILYMKALVASDTGILIGAVLFQTVYIYTKYIGGVALVYYKDQIYPIIYAPAYYSMMILQQFNVWITVSVATERYIAICHPFRAETLITREKNKIVIITIATISILYNIPHLFATEAVGCTSTNSTDVSILYSTPASVNTNSSSGSVFPIPSVTPKSQFDILSTSVYPVNTAKKNCLTVGLTDFGSSWYYIKFQSILYAVIIHAIPFLSLVILNSLLIKELMAMQMRHMGTNVADDEANLSLALFMIIVVFIICQTPALISQFKINITHNQDFTLLAVSNLMFATNSSVNFLIYTAFGRKYREVLLHVFRRLYNWEISHQTAVPEKPQYSNNDYEMSNVGGNDIVQNEKYSDGHNSESKVSDKTNGSTSKQSDGEKPLNDMASVNEVS